MSLNHLHTDPASCSDLASGSAAAAYELRFCSLFDAGRGFAFPCDAGGQVDLDGLSERARNNYLFARASVGYDFSMPAVRPAKLH